MRDRKLALRYARALLSVYPDPAQAERTEEFLLELGAAIERNPEMRDLMLDPAYPREHRVAFLHTLVQRAGLDQRVANFMSLLAHNRRLSALPSIASVFHEERERAMGIVPAEITTATPLTEDMKRRAQSAVERLTGSKVRLTCQVAPDLIGGAVTRVGSTIYDGSLRTQLARMRRAMSHD